MLLSTGIFLLCSEHLCASHIDYVQELFRFFVYDFGRIYGKQMIIYNVHVLLHLADHCRLYGPLHNFSGFPFENFGWGSTFPHTFRIQWVGEDEAILSGRSSGKLGIAAVVGWKVTGLILT